MAVEPTRLVWSPHPLLPAAERSLHAQEPRNGENLRDYLHRGPVDLSLPLKVWLADREIPREDWSSTPVQPGQIVTAHALARGGDGSDPVATILTIAVLVAAPQFAPNVNAALGLAADSAIGGALITVGGMYLVSQLNRPPEPLNDETDPSPSYSLSGGGNRARQHQPLPLVIGTHRIYPDLGAQPFTELRGPDQYLMQVFNFGLSDLTLSDYKIGDTLLSSYSDYRIEESDASGALTLFPGNVDSLGGADLTLGTWVQLTSSQNCNRLAVDISGLLFYAGNEGLEQLRATLQLEYRPVGDTTWNSLTGSVDHRETVDNGSRDPVRLSYSNFAPLVASPNGQYEVRVQFVSLQRRKVVTTWVPYDDTTGTGGYSEQTVTYETISLSNNRVTAQFHWDQLKSYQPDTADYSGQKRMALEIRATAQLNGAVSALNAIASARCEVWNGSAWVTQATSNPAWWFRWFALGKTDANGRRLFGGGYTDADLDLDRIKAWGAWCDSKGLAVNLVLDQPRNCYDLLSMIARCGRASLSWGSGRLGVVYDQANQPAVAVFGMSNIVRDSFRIDYISGNLPDEIVLNWINPALGYRPDTVRQALPGVTNPQNPVTVDLPGITSELQAGREANLIAAEQQYRVRSISWETDLEGLAVSRGDVVTLSHDLTQWGYSGRLISGTTTTLVLDRKVPFTDGQQHYIGLRAPDGSYAIHEVNAQTGESDTLTLTTALPSAPDDDPDNPPIDYLWCFEPKATPGKRVKITDIRPVSEHRVRLIATDEDDAYYLAENDSYSYVTPSNNLPGLPTLGNLTIQTNLLRSGKGFTAEITLAWDADGEYGGAFVRAGYNDEPLSDRGRTLDRSFRFLAPTDGKISVEVTGFNQRGQFGPSSRVSGSLIYNARVTEPDDPTALSVAILPDGTRQLLPQVPALPADYLGCLYRARAGSWTTWDELSEANGGLHLHDEPVADIPWETAQIPQGQYTIGVKVVDLYGNESQNPALAVVTLPAQPTSVTKTSELTDDANLSGLKHQLNGEPQRAPEDNLSIEVDNYQGSIGWYKIASCRLTSSYDAWTFNGVFEWGSSNRRYIWQARVAMSAQTGNASSVNQNERFIVSSPDEAAISDKLRMYRVDNGDGTFTWSLYVKAANWSGHRLRGVFAIGGGTSVTESWYDEYQTPADSLGSTYTPPGTQIAATFNYQPGADVTSQNTAAGIANQGGLATADTVGTPEINADSVTTINGATFADATPSLYATVAGWRYSTLGQLSITADGDNKVMVNATITATTTKVNNSSSFNPYYQIWRDGTLLEQRFASGTDRDYAFIVNDNPPAGSHTYYIKAAIQVNTGSDTNPGYATFNAREMRMTLQGVKR